MDVFMYFVQFGNLSGKCLTKRPCGVIESRSIQTYVKLFIWYLVSCVVIIPKMLLGRELENRLLTLPKIIS